MRSFLVLAAFALNSLWLLHGAQTEVVAHPQPYTGPIRNPLMGFVGPTEGSQPYATLSFQYVKWNEIENSAGDGVDKIRDYADTHWKGVEQRNIKIVPRLHLEWPRGSSVDSYWPVYSYWPADMPRDFAGAQFKERVVRMIAKLGEAWDSDPRIAFVEMGIIGAWGEQHHPSPDDEMQELLGDAFQRAFKHKLVAIRYPWQFKKYPFGIYWDSFGNPGWEMRTHVPEFEGRLSDRWKTAPMIGEMSFASSRKTTKQRLARTPTEAVAGHADTLIQYIRRWHWTDLSWVSSYDLTNAAAAAGAARIQSVFGYRYMVDEVRYPARLEPGGRLVMSFKVRNLGSAPMYYNWPVEVSLLDRASHQPVWKATFTKVDIRKWLPGNFSDIGKGQPVGDKDHSGFAWKTGLDYDIAPASHEVHGTFKLPAGLSAGNYFLALAILDPAGNLPAVKFAIRNYFKGGRHPMGNIAVGCENSGSDLAPSLFDDPAADTSLHYIVDLPAR